MRYYEDFVKPQKKFRLPDEVEAGALRALSDALGKAGATATAEELQGIIYDVGRTVPRYQDPNAKGATPDKPGVSNAWFGTIYQVLLGEERGPRFGSFVELYGVDNTRKLIERAVAGELVSQGGVAAFPLPTSSWGEGQGEGQRHNPARARGCPSPRPSPRAVLGRGEVGEARGEGEIRCPNSPSRRNVRRSYPRAPGRASHWGRRLPATGCDGSSSSTRQAIGAWKAGPVLGDLVQEAWSDRSRSSAGYVGHDAGCCDALSCRRVLPG